MWSRWNDTCSREWPWSSLYWFCHIFSPKNNEPTWKLFVQHNRTRNCSSVSPVEYVFNLSGDVQFNKPNVSVVFNWRWMCIVRSSRINPASTDVSSLSMTNDRYWPWLNVFFFFFNKSFHHAYSLSRLANDLDWRGVYSVVYSLSLF
jgi:hypothetical protein